MAKKKRSSRPKTRTITATTMIPALLLMGTTLFGSAGGKFRGVIPAIRSGDFQAAGREAINIPSRFLIGGNVIGGGSPLASDVESMTAFYGSAILGRVAHTVASKTGANRGLSATQRMVGLRTVVVV